MNLHHEMTGRYFDAKADSFDAIYTGEKCLLGRLWDSMTRQNVMRRRAYALRTLHPIEGKSILDAGCGSGRCCIEFARRGAHRVLGVDSSREMIRKATTIRETNDISVCEFRQMNIMDVRESFDYTCALGFFDYIREPDTVLAFLRSITIERIAASFPSAWAFRSPMRKVWYSIHRVPTSFYTRRRITDLFAQAGFTIVECVHAGPLYLVNAR